MKYYFCMMLCVGALNGMDAPPASPQWQSAPNSPTKRQYTRDQMLAIGQSVLARTQSCTITISEIKREPDNWRQVSSRLSKSCDFTEVQNSAPNQPKPASRRIMVIRKKQPHDKK